MAKEAVKKEIDDKKYTIGYLNPFVALRLKNKILKMVAPALGGIKGGSLQDAEIDIKMIVDGIVEHLDENQIEEIFKTLFSQVLCDGNRLTDEYVEVNYKGELNHLYKVVFAALEVQFGDFFDGNGALAGLKGKLPLK